MPNPIKLKRSAVAAAVPSSLEFGELALNYNAADGKLFYKNSAGVIVAFESGGGEDALLRSLFLPPAPTGVTASAGNAQATVSWTAPTVLAQTPITDYAVQFQPAGGSWQTFTDSVSTATSATVTGLTNGTAYTFKVAATNAVGTGSYSTASSAVTPVAGDALWANVQLLLPGDTSTNDVSSYNRRVTAVGGAAVSTAQKRWGAGSLYFDGSGDYLTIPGVNIASGDFALEMWFKTASGVQYAQLIGNEASGGSEGFSLLINNNSATGGQVALYCGGLVVSSSSGDWSDDQWHHIAVSRSGSTVRLYLDGSLASTGSSSSSFSSSSALYVAYNNQFSPRNVVGYIDDLRITVGSNRGYTGSTIPVPAANFPTVGPSGVASDGYFSSVSLLLHADGTGSTFVDSSPTPKSIAATNATQSATQSRWGGKSAYFDGSSWLTVPQASISLGSQDFVIECWFYMTASTSGYKTLWAQRPTTSSIGGAAAVIDGSSLLYFISNSSASVWAVSGASTGLTVPAAQWNHIAMVRSGNTVTLYLNGTAGTPVSFSEAVGSSGDFSIGAGAASGDQAVTGFLDDFRITVNSNRGYTGATITVPTAAFPDA
jgi:hypothetical protein